MNRRIHLSDPLPNSYLCLFSPLDEPILAEPGTGLHAELAGLGSAKTARSAPRFSHYEAAGSW